MEMKDKDILRGLFAAMPDEQLPDGFNDRIMQRVFREAARREKRLKWLSIVGYASGVAAMVAACIVTLYYSGVSFVLPELPEWSWTWSFPEPDFGLFKSPYFIGSMYVGILGLLLLVIESLLRRRAGK